MFIFYGFVLSGVVFGFFGTFYFLKICSMLYLDLFFDRIYQKGIRTENPQKAMSIGNNLMSVAYWNYDDDQHYKALDVFQRGYEICLQTIKSKKIHKIEIVEMQLFQDQIKFDIRKHNKKAHFLGIHIHHPVHVQIGVKY